MTFGRIDFDEESNENDRLLSNGKYLNNTSQDDPESEEDSTSSKFKRALAAVRKRLKKDGLRFILLVILNGLYLYLGGLIFYLLERQPKVIIDEKRHIELLLNSLKASNINFNSSSNVQKTVSNLSDDDVSKISATLRDVHNQLKDSESDEWTITTAVFFASTVITTIGYGNLTPVTDAGRWFCVVYAIVGIPITVMLLALVGKIISKYINHTCGFIITKMRKYLYPEYEYERVEDDTELRAPVWLALLFMVMVAAIFAIVFTAMEEWSFTKSLYFIFITFTTIGFGDIVPRNSEAIWFNVTFLYIGLAALSITVNLIIANITAQYHKHKTKIKLVKKLEEELNDSDDDDVIHKNTTSAKPVMPPTTNETNDVTKMSDLKGSMESDEDDNNNSSSCTNGVNGL